MRQAREIATNEPLAGLLAGEDTPDERVDDDERPRAWVRRTIWTVFHPTSSLAMGGGDEAVCDPELRVRGVDGLRVVDASVLPAVPRGNTNAPTVAVAERAADLIRGDTPAGPRRGGGRARRRLLARAGRVSADDTGFPKGPALAVASYCR